MLSFEVNFNCLTKSVTFSKRLDQVGEKFLIAGQVKNSLDNEACVFMMFASLKGDVEKGVSDLLVVKEFPEVVPNDIIGLPPEKEVVLDDIIRYESYFDGTLSDVCIRIG